MMKTTDIRLGGCTSFLLLLLLPLPAATLGLINFPLEPPASSQSPPPSILRLRIPGFTGRKVLLLRDQISMPRSRSFTSISASSASDESYPASSLPRVLESTLSVPVFRGDPFSPSMNLQKLSCSPNDNSLASFIASVLPKTIVSSRDEGLSRPPLLFLHGSFHGAWCYAERFLPYFASEGYSCTTYSFRGTGTSPILDSNGDVDGAIKKVAIESHVDDLEALLDSYSSGAKKPIIVAHSFGGAVLMKYMERCTLRGKLPAVSGVATLCSVPPSGNGPMTGRFLRRDLVAAYRITVGFVAKKLASDIRLCQKLFFDEAAAQEDLKRYMGYYKRDSVVSIDIAGFSKSLPSVHADKNGVAPWVATAGPRLVVGAIDDYVVDKEGVMETAQFLDTDAIFVDSPHNVMLGKRWNKCAQTIRSWLEENFS